MRPELRVEEEDSAELKLTWNDSSGLVEVDQLRHVERETASDEATAHSFRDTAARAYAEFELVVRRYTDYVTRLALRMTGKKSEADDITQDVFEVAFASFDRLRDRDSVQAWLKTITRRTSQKRLLRGSSDPTQNFDMVAEALEVPSSIANPEQRFLLSCVEQAIESLPEEERRVWLLRHFDEEAMEDIARLCSCSLSTVQRRLRSAECKIKKTLGATVRRTP